MPADETFDTLSDEFPEFFSVIVCGLVLPCVTFPKFTEAGVADNCAVWFTPVPVKGTDKVDPGALLARLRDPE